MRNETQIAERSDILDLHFSQPASQKRFSFYSGLTLTVERF